jgi:hypothetical protein
MDNAFAMAEIQRFQQLVKIEPDIDFLQILAHFPKILIVNKLENLFLDSGLFLRFYQNCDFIFIIVTLFKQLDDVRSSLQSLKNLDFS